MSCMQVFGAAHSMPPNAIYTNYIVCTLSTQAINPVCSGSMYNYMSIRSPLQDQLNGTTHKVAEYHGM